MSDPIVLDRVNVTGQAYEVCCRLARMAGAPKPHFVEWGKLYRTSDGCFRIMADLRPNGRSTYEDDSGRKRSLPKGDSFHDLIAYLEHVDVTETTPAQHSQPAI